MNNMYQFLIFALGQAKICGQFICSMLIVPKKKTVSAVDYFDGSNCEQVSYATIPFS
jgi:hypothetical protein